MPGIINGDRWIAERLETLRRRLAEDPPVDERAAIEAEIAVLSKERGLGPGGRRTGGILSRVLRRVRRPD